MLYPDARYKSSSMTQLVTKRHAELERTKTQMQRLEEGADMISGLERKRLAFLNSFGGAGNSSLDVGDKGFRIAELKEHLERVYEADMAHEEVVQQVALGQCIGYTVGLLKHLVESNSTMLTADYDIIELGMSSLAMLSQRCDSHEAFHASGAPTLLVRLLSPLYPMELVVHATTAVGNLATHDHTRASLRLAGCVAALVRCLRSDVDLIVSAAAAVALSHLAARDSVVQDTTRHMGGIGLLVDLLVSNDVFAYESARLCLLSLRHVNAKNQIEVIASLRAHPDAVRLIGPTSELLRLSDDMPSGSATSMYIRRPWTAPHGQQHSGSTGAAQEQLMHSNRPGTAASSVVCRPVAASPNMRRTLTSPSTDLNRSAAASSVRALIHDIELQRARASLRSPRESLRSYYPSTPMAVSLGTGIDAGFRSPTYEHRPASPLAYSPASPLTYSPASLSTGASGGSSPWSGSSSHDHGAAGMTSLGPQTPREMARKKHLSSFSSGDTCVLLEEMGFDWMDLRGFEVQRVDGFRLLEMSEEELLIDLVLPRSKVEKIKILQRATNLFDRISSSGRGQGCLSESEFRLYLAGQGASSLEVSKILRLLKTLLKTGFYDFVTFWDFVTGFDWVVQAFNIYHIPA